MKDKIKIAFDLDGIIIDKPPLIPKKLIDWLFRGKRGDKIYYRFPKSKIEQKIRKLSHFYLFRPPIKENICFLRKVAQDKKYELYVVSARYSFLRRETEVWLRKRRILGLFKKIFLNLNDEQPHLFKEKILKDIKPKIFVEDDDLLADYLVGKKISKILFFSPTGTGYSKARTIKNISEIIK